MSMQYITDEDLEESHPFGGVVGPVVGLETACFVLCVVTPSVCRDAVLPYIEVCIKLGVVQERSRRVKGTGDVEMVVNQAAILYRRASLMSTERASANG